MLFGFLIMMVGINIIVVMLIFLNDIFIQGFGMKGYIIDVVVIVGLVNWELGLEVVLMLLVIFVVNIIIVWLMLLKYIFLIGQVLLWMVMIGVVIGYKFGFIGVLLILIGGIFGGVMVVLMLVLVQLVVRCIIGFDDVVLGYFCIIGYLVQVVVVKVVGKGFCFMEDFELFDNFKFLQDIYLVMVVVMVLMYFILVIVVGFQYIVQFFGGINYLMYVFMQFIQFVVGVFVFYSGVCLLFNELVLVFCGIVMCIVLDVKFVFDCLVLFFYVLNVVIVGFLVMIVGLIIGMLVFLMFGLVMIFFGLLINFFVGGMVGVFGNVLGGCCGVMIGGVIYGLFIILLLVILVFMLESYGFMGVIFSDLDVISFGLVLGYVFQNNWFFVVLFIVFVVVLVWFVNGKFVKLKGESVYEFV